MKRNMSGKDRRARLVAHFRQHGRATGDQLAEVVSVAVRTIYRDVSELQAYGVPISGRRGDGYVWKGDRA